MSIYNPSIPQPNDDLSDSQPQILGNFSSLDTIFGIDHYKFSNLTTSKGFHNKVTTPAFVDSPPTGLPPTTIAAIPIAYAFQDSANVGVIQYSRGPSNAVPTPLTNLQSTSTPIVLLNNGTTNILDFTGLARAFCLVYAADMPGAVGPRVAAYVVWSGSAFAISMFAPTLIQLAVQNSGNILQIRNASGVTLSNVYWTMDMQRLS